MKKTLLLAAACLALGACSHRQTRQEPVADRANGVTTTTTTTTTAPVVDTSTASGSSSSLGAVSSGRGH